MAYIVYQIDNESKGFLSYREAIASPIYTDRKEAEHARDTLMYSSGGFDLIYEIRIIR